MLVYISYGEDKLPVWILLPASTHARGEDIFKLIPLYMIAKGNTVLLFIQTLHSQHGFIAHVKSVALGYTGATR
jgi:hypothetical protein